MQGGSDDARARPRQIAPRGRDGVLRLLAHGQSPAEIARRAGPSARSGKPSDARDLKAIFVDARRALAEETLRPPALTAFLEKPRINDSTFDLVDLRDRARELVSEAIILLEQPGREASTAVNRANEDAFSYAALRYAEALVRQEDVLEALGHVNRLTAPLHATLTGDDRRRLDDFLLYRNVKGRFETLDSLIDAWDRLVAGLARAPSSLTYDEFTDRLRSRDSLETAVAQVTPLARGPLVAAVAPLDRRYLEHTNAQASSIRRSAAWRVDPWWWFRVPRAPGSRFREQLAAVTTGGTG